MTTRQSNNDPSSSSFHPPSSPRRIQSKHHILQHCFTILLLLLVCASLCTFWLYIKLVNSTSATSPTHLFGKGSSMIHMYHHITKDDVKKEEVDKVKSSTTTTSAAEAEAEAKIKLHNPPINIPKEDKTPKTNPPPPPPPPPDDELIYHFVVSSDCTTDQKWQVLTQIHSATAVNQEGKFTWLVSGCFSEEEDEEKNERGLRNSKKAKQRKKKKNNVLTQEIIVQEINQHFPPPNEDKNGWRIQRPNVHFTPDYSDMSIYGGPYADGTKKRLYFNPQTNKTEDTGFANSFVYNNKPNALRHFAQSLHQEEENNNEAIVLLDPDFLFLKRFELSKEKQPEPRKPVAAKYDLGVEWVDFNTTAICGPESACNTITKMDVWKYYTAGPPILLHISDVLEFSTLWSSYVPKVYDQYPKLYAEMYAYSMAAVHLGMKHDLIKDIMTGCMVGWNKLETMEEKEALMRGANDYKELVAQQKGGGEDDDERIGDDNDDGCVGPSSCFYKPVEPPPFLHYCARYELSSISSTLNDKNEPPREEVEEDNTSYYFFYKYRVHHDILDSQEIEVKEYPPFESQRKKTVTANHGPNGVEWNALTVCAVDRAIEYARKKRGGKCI